MARRLYKTTADYLAIAVTPALIMALVTSLVFFLLTVFYQGGHLARLQYIMFLFVFAAVLIARIAMEEGRERAMLFSLALALAVAVTVSRFSDLGMLVNFGLIALIWWSADRLTWDCTLIDERENATGEGLLQTVGLDRSKPTERCGATVHADVEPLGVTGRDQEPERKTWWRRAWEYFHAPHAPGVWVVYFSLAALPIFGLGQRFIPASDTSARRAAFLFLFIYVASALGLLLATCFLGLRRYLRQRRVEMPDNLAMTWVATGVALIAALLIVCTLLPRPSAEYAVSRVPFGFDSPTNWTSPFSIGDDGVKEDEKSGPGEDKSPTPDNGATRQPQGNDQSGDSRDRGPSDETREPGQQQGEQGKANEAQDGGGAENQESSGQGNQGADSDQSQDNSGQPQDGEGQKQQSQNEASGQGGRSAKPQPGDSSPSQQSPQSAAAQPPPPTSSQPQTPDQTPPQQQPPATPQNTPPPRPQSNSFSWMRSIVGWLGTLLKFALYAVLIAVGIWLFRKYKDELLAGFRDLLKDLRDFWNQIFGRKQATTEAAEAAPAATAPTYRPFSSYPDPFAGGKAGRYTPEQLVKYSFEAFEAWARERGCPRHPDQTPHEFAQAIGAKNAAVSQPARALADLYSRLAYAAGPLPSSTIEHLTQLWTVLRS